MANFIDLPPEIVLWVFKSLDNIDDALHLTRCCKYFHSISDGSSVRLKIFRSIISRAPQHQHDLALNQYIQMHSTFASEFYNKPSIPADPDRRRWYLNMLEPLEYGKNIPDMVVWDIVCRWHGMRLFYDMYCNKAISEAFIASRFAFTSGVTAPSTTEASASEGDLPKPSRILHPFAEKMELKVGKDNYEQFYKALTAQWVAIECLWRVRSQVWPDARAFDQAFASTMRQWTNNPRMSLKDKLNIVEIVDFLWGFLARRTFHVSSIPSWLEGEGDLVREQYIDQDERESDTWGFFVRSVSQYLRPPQIMQLVLSSWYPSTWAYSRPEFIRSLGVFDTWEGILMENQHSPLSDNWVPLDVVDDNVGNSLSHVGNAKEIEGQWERFRETDWFAELRGEIFLRRLTEEEIVYQIVGSIQEASCCQTQGVRTSSSWRSRGLQNPNHAFVESCASVQSASANP